MMYEPGGTEMKPMLLLLFTKSKSSESQLLTPWNCSAFQQYTFLLRMLPDIKKSSLAVKACKCF